MYDRILSRMRAAIRTRNYVMTLYAEDEMNDDNLSIFDVERIILTGEIIERQKDEITKEWKYLIEGDTISNAMAIVVSKLKAGVVVGRLPFHRLSYSGRILRSASFFNDGFVVYVVQDFHQPDLAGMLCPQALQVSVPHSSLFLFNHDFFGFP